MLEKANAQAHSFNAYDRPHDDLREFIARAESAEELDEIQVPRLELPALPDGVDLGSLYELADALAHQGVR